MFKWVYILTILLTAILASSAFAVPLAEMKVKYKNNEDGTYTYFIRLTNQGPILPNVTTPKDHTVMDWSTFPPTAYDAAGKYLTDDAYLVLFGIDTGMDDITVSGIGDGNGSFHGTVEQGFNDSDMDGVNNTVVAWHLPFFGWSLDDAIAPGERLTGLRFTANKKLDQIVFWVGGSDDAIIWDDTHIMSEDAFGIYDATVGAYLAVFFEREIRVKPIRCRRDCD